MRFGRAREILLGRAHIEKAKGSDLENENYCSKSGEVWIHGQPCSQGTRTDLEKVVHLIEGGERNIQKLAVQCPIAYIKYYKGIGAFLRMRAPAMPRSFKTECYYLWGPPGSGKSRTANEEAMSRGTVYYKPRGEWWDGYEQQDSVIIDDFYGWIKYDEMLKICDRYPYQVPVKFGFEIFNSKYIYITSNVSIEECYRFIAYDPAALKRRMTKIVYME